MLSIHAATGGFDWGRAWLAVAVILGITLVSLGLSWVLTSFPKTGIILLLIVVLGGAFYLAGKP